MMRTTKLVLSLGSVLAVTLTCLAQNDPARPPGKPGQPQIQTGDQITYPLKGVRARDLIGKNVENEQGKKVGDINDVLIDVPQSRVAGVIVGVGGVLGVGEHPRIVPPQVFEWNATDKKLMLRMDEQLRTGKTRAEDLKSYNELTQVYRDYQQEPYWDKQTRQPVRDKDGQITKETQSPNQATQFRLRKAKELLGANVDDTANKKLGEIEDLVVDLHSGRLVLIAVGAGGVLGVGEKLVAIPPSQLQMNPDGKFMINATVDQLKTAPQFDKHQWPDLNDAAWVSKVYGHYGDRSYWIEGNRQPVRDIDKKP
jgi:sporulation protein YlmC with PRC-barrel domain